MRSSLKIAGLGVLGLACALRMVGEAAAIDAEGLRITLTHVKAMAADGSRFDALDLDRTDKLFKISVSVPKGDPRKVFSGSLRVNGHRPASGPVKMSSKAKGKFAFRDSHEVFQFDGIHGLGHGGIDSVVMDNFDGTGTLVVTGNLIDPSVYNGVDPAGILPFSQTLTMPLLNGMRPGDLPGNLQWIAGAYSLSRQDGYLNMLASAYPSMGPVATGTWAPDGGSLRVSFTIPEGDRDETLTPDSVVANRHVLSRDPTPDTSLFTWDRGTPATDTAYTANADRSVDFSGTFPASAVNSDAYSRSHGYGWVDLWYSYTWDGNADWQADPNDPRFRILKVRAFVRLP